MLIKPEHRLNLRQINRVGRNSSKPSVAGTSALRTPDQGSSGYQSHSPVLRNTQQTQQGDEIIMLSWHSVVAIEVLGASFGALVSFT